MKKIAIRILVPLLVFIGCTLFFNLLMNHGETLDTADMKAASLPIMYMEVEGIQVNRMVGTKEQILDLTDRDSLTPVNMDHKLTLILDKRGNVITDITYTVMSVDRSSVNENAVLKNFDAETEQIKATITLEQPLLMHQEYLLEFGVRLKDGSVYYYTTRIIQRNEIDLSKYLEFVTNFADKCLDKEQAGSLSSFVESSVGASNNSFYNVDIHSSLDQITWGKLNPSMVTKAIPQIREMNAVTLSVTQEYLIKAMNDEGQTEYYTVSEFYRMRKGAERIVLLDFERSAEQLFDPQLPVLTSSGISLGINGLNVEYQTNVARDIAAFIVNGDLWSYNRSAGKCTSIYTFRSEVGAEPDIREIYQKHNTQIVRVDEFGDIVFIVYGYMNCGEHEGEMGADIFYYRAEQNLVEEKIFIPANCSYRTLKANVEKLSYVSAEGLLYLYMDHTLYQINLEDGVVETVAVNIPDSGFVVSDSQSLVAWATSEGVGEESTICVLNLDNNETLVLSANPGERLQSLGFIDEDFICGSANASDLFISSEGTVAYYLHTIWIYDISGNLRKEYRQDGCYITDVSVEAGRVDMKRVIRTENGYVHAEDDHITSGELQSSDGVKKRLSTISERTGQQLILEFEDNGSAGTPLYLKPKYIFSDLTGTLTISYPEITGSRYYVYGKGKLLTITASCADAIRLADEQVGIVLNNAQQYVWERGVTADSVSIDPVGEPEAFRNASLDISELAASLSENQELLNLSGCTLKEIEYMLSNHRSVVARTGVNESRLIVGFDIYNNYQLYDPETGEISLIGPNDGTRLFDENGNVFYSYTSSFS